jgi:Fe-S-cluster-containing hydrogenase component 2
MLMIEVDRCTGCGICVQTCPRGAISLVSGIARIDSSLCNECQACVDICPTGAIQAAMPILQRSDAMTAGDKQAVPVSTAQRGALATLAAATFSFVGRYVLPRAAEALVSILEQRANLRTGTSEPAPSTPQTSGASIATGSISSSGGHRQRHRGGR